MMILVCIYIYTYTKSYQNRYSPLPTMEHISIFVVGGVQDSANVGVLVYSIANQQHLLNQECFGSNRLMNLLTTSGYLTIPGFCDGFLAWTWESCPKRLIKLTHNIQISCVLGIYVFGVQILCQEVFGCLILWINFSLTQSFSKNYPVWI